MTMNFRTHADTPTQTPACHLWFDMEAIQTVLVWLTLCLQGLLSRELYVRPDASVRCPSDPCLSLSEYAENQARYFASGDSFLFLGGGEHVLNASVTLVNVTGISLTSVESTARLSMLSEVSLSWVDSRQVLVSSLDVRYQGRANNSSAFLFNNSKDIQIRNVQFTGLNVGQNRSRAIGFIQTTAEVVNCSFFCGYSNNGGAIWVEESTVTFSGTNVYTNNTADVSGGAIYSTNSVLAFQGSNTFLNNSAITLITNSVSGGGAIFTTGGSYTTMSGFSHFRGNGPVDPDAFLSGGALNLFNSTLIIRDRAIFERNSGTYAGAMQGYNSNIYLEGHMTFTDNRYAGCISLFISNFTCDGEFNFTNNEIVVTEGFGSVLYAENSTLSLFGKIRFEKNTALNGVGGAVFTFNSRMRFHGDIHFVGNYAAGDIGGAVCLDRSSLECEGNITFSNNTAEYRGGGVYAIDSVVTTTGNSSFVGNMAVEGGGMGFEGSSELVLKSPVNMNFYRNQAETNGGAILVLDSSSIAQCQNISVQRRDCFFRVESDGSSSMDVTLDFTGNTAMNAGSLLYGGSLQLCRVRVDGKQVKTDSLQYLQNISSFEDSNSGISSDPLKVCFCNSSGADCVARQVKELSIHRGELLTLSVITVGQEDMPVPSTLRGYIRNNDETTELVPQSHMINGTCTNVTFRLYTEDTSKVMILYPDGPCGNTDNTRRKVSISLYPCPPGFELVGNRCECEERLLELNSTNMCNIDTLLVERPGNTWIKPLYDEDQSYIGFVLHPNCPFTYCKPAEESVLLDFSSNNSDSQCSNNRSGILCGACRVGHSVILNDYHCAICHNKSISLFLFFAFAGVALIIVLLGLHMTVAAGTINGLILYANIVNVNGVIFFPHDRTNILTVFISWLNLDLGIQTCLYDGLTFYSYAWLEYAFPLYLWFLIGAIVVSIKISARVGRLFGSNPMAVLATVILMSYTKLLQTAIFALSYTNLEYPDGSRKKVWLFDANITYLEGKHISLSIAALCVVFLLLIPYLLLLLFGYRLQKYSGMRAFFWFNKFKPLLDAYYAPYRKQTRYWPGLMLLIRACLYLAFSFNALGNVSANLVAISSVFTVLAIIPWLSNRIYEKFYNDVLEASFILNICILSTATYHVISAGGKQDVVTYLSVGIAFVQFMGIVVYHTYVRINKTMAHKYLTSAKEKMKKWAATFKSEKMTPQDKKTIPFTTSVVELREPLLEDTL